MRVVLDPRMRRLYAKMMECRTGEDLEHFHEQLYYQYGKKQSAILCHRLYLTARRDRTVHQGATVNPPVQAMLLARVFAAEYTRAAAQAMKRSEDANQRADRVRVLTKHGRDTTKIVKKLGERSILRYITQRAYISVAKAVLVFFSRYHLALHDQTLTSRIEGLSRLSDQYISSRLESRNGPKALYAKYITLDSLKDLCLNIVERPDEPKPRPIEIPGAIILDLLRLAVESEGEAPESSEKILALLRIYIATLALSSSNTLPGRDWRFVHGWTDVPWLSEEVNLDLRCDLLDNTPSADVRRSLLRKVLWDMGRSVPGPA